MKVLAITRAGELLGLAHMLSTVEGHECTFYVNDRNIRSEINLVPHSSVRTPLLLPSKAISQATLNRLTNEPHDFAVLGTKDFGSAQLPNALRPQFFSNEGELSGVPDVWVYGWWVKEQLCNPALCLIKNHLGDGDKGPSAGVVGCVLFSLAGTKLAKWLEHDVVPKLPKSRVDGPVLLHPRLLTAFPPPVEAIYTALEGWPAAPQLYEFAHQDVRLVPPPWKVGVLVSAPPYPYEVKEWAQAGVEWPKAAEKHVWPMDISAEKKSRGGRGVLVTAYGSTLGKALDRVYRTVHNIGMKDKQFRGDLDTGVRDLMKALGSWVERS